MDKNSFSQGLHLKNQWTNWHRVKIELTVSRVGFSLSPKL